MELPPHPSMLENVGVNLFPTIEQNRRTCAIHRRQLLQGTIQTLRRETNSESIITTPTKAKSLTTLPITSQVPRCISIQGTVCGPTEGTVRTRTGASVQESSCALLWVIKLQGAFSQVSS